MKHLLAIITVFMLFVAIISTAEVDNKNAQIRNVENDAFLEINELKSENLRQKHRIDILELENLFLESTQCK